MFLYQPRAVFVSSSNLKLNFTFDFFKFFYEGLKIANKANWGQLKLSILR